MYACETPEACCLQAPVFRALYSEKQVVQEERRLRVDNSPMGRWQESFLAAAFANNYGRPVIGYSEDVAGLGRREVQQFFNEHYGPLRLTISVVGDVQASQVGRVQAPHGSCTQGLFQGLFPVPPCMCLGSSRALPPSAGLGALGSAASSSMGTGTHSCCAASTVMQPYK